MSDYWDPQFIGMHCDLTSAAIQGPAGMQTGCGLPAAFYWQ
jgi:hypothetical protein